MVNVTRAPGQPGSWINPSLTATVPSHRFFPVPANQNLGLVDSSKSNRQVIGRANAITINGTAEANQRMLALLKAGRLLKP